MTAYTFEIVEYQYVEIFNPFRAEFTLRFSTYGLAGVIKVLSFQDE
jgi:hypothetical protein